ncbi:MAG: DUF998 domain-containing protein, partial [Pseudomonadota bacterium]
ATATPILHSVVLAFSGQNGITAPINALSQTAFGGLQTLGLVLFGLAHVALSLELAGRHQSRLWQVGRLLLGASGGLLFYVAFYFMSANPETLRGPDASDPLWFVASLIGLSMGALQPGLSRIAQGLGLFSAVCLGLWIWLAGFSLMVDETWLGLYERTVGAVYVTWIIGVAAALLQPHKEGGPKA